MKVAICTIFHRNYNYGGMLQAFALQYKLKQMGFDAYTVNYDNGANPIYPSLFSRCKQYTLKQLFAKLRNVYIERKTYLISEHLDKRIELFTQFALENISQTKIYTDATCDELGRSFDVFICGSDQIWNPNVVSKFYLCDFETSSDVIKIAYAASIGRDNLTQRESQFMIPYLNNYTAIAVREKSARSILKQNNVNKPIEVVLDPTFLLTMNQWDDICSSRIILEPYVLMYSFSNCFLKTYIMEYYKKRSYRVVFIPYAKQKYNAFDRDCQMEPMWEIGPAEFLSLIKYADYVYTDSFHAVVFSIIFNKQFYVYERSTKGQTSMNSRIYDLLDLFDLNGRLIRATEIPENNYIAYDSVNEKVQEMRIYSVDWLQQVLTKYYRD